MWHCPACKKVCGAAAELSEVEDESDEDEAREGMGLQDWEDVPPGKFVHYPEIVACPHCGEVADVDLSEFGIGE